MTPKELEESILGSRMQPDQARKFLTDIRDHIDGMLAANGDTKKIVWHFIRARKLVQGRQYGTFEDLARCALIASKEPDWFVAIFQAAEAKRKQEIAEYRAARTQCAKCLAEFPHHAGTDYTHWLLPGEKCPGCEFRRANEEWKRTGVWPKDVPV